MREGEERDGAICVRSLSSAKQSNLQPEAMKSIRGDVAQKSH